MRDEVIRQSTSPRYSSLALPLAFGLLTACASSLRVGSDRDQSASFISYHTFTLQQQGRASGTRNPLVADAIRADLTERGYVEVTDPHAADLTIDFTISVKANARYSFPAACLGGFGCMGQRDYAIDAPRNREVRLSVDVFDTHSHRAVWHGWGMKELGDDDVDDSTARVRYAVAAILAKFPSVRAGTVNIARR